MLIKVQTKKWIVFFLTIVFFCNTSVHSQKKKKVHVMGTSISLDKTPKDALKDAKKNAKENALKKAGITELISVSRILFEESSINDHTNQFNEISSIESNANIIIDSIYQEKKSFDKFGNMIVSVEIDATVFKYKKERDPTFFFKIDELKDIYYENEYLSFSFIPSQDGYLNIFVLNEMGSILLYPFEDINQKYLSDVKNKLFRKNEKVSFPIHKAFRPGYTVELETENMEELSTFIFVFTKNNITWMENKIEKKTILNWIYRIPIYQREIYYRSIILKKPL